MNEKIHGRRYSFTEKKEILKYLEKHTYKDTVEKYGISEPTLARWRKMIKSESKKNRQKLVVSLPKFWLEYLNDQIESDVWEDYSDAILNVIRYYFKSQTSIQNVDSIYIENIERVVSTFLKLNPDIDSIILSNSTKVLYKTEQWESTEGINSLIETWKKLSAEWKNASWWKTESKRSGKTKEFEFQNNKYYIRDLSAKHLIGAPPQWWLHNFGFLLGLKKKMEKEDVYIIAKTKDLNDLMFNIETNTNTLKKIAMGKLPTTSEEKYWIDLIDKSKSRLRPNEEIKTDFRQILRPYEEITAEWEQNHQELIKQQKKNLMGIAKKMNLSLQLNEMEVLGVLEKQIGKKIERITVLLEEPQKVFGLGKDSPIHKNIIIPSPDEDFPANKFTCHYIALNGKVILLSLFNLGLSEFPSEILKLRSLSYLCLNSNSITELPKTFSDLKSLEYLLLDNNQFTQVPDSIIELPRLHHLYMRNNKISKIPLALTDAWQARTGDPLYRGSIYLPSNLIFSGNPIERSSLSKEQLELEHNSFKIPYVSKRKNMHRHFLFVID